MTIELNSEVRGRRGAGDGVDHTRRPYAPSRGPDIWPPLIAALAVVVVMLWSTGDVYRPDLAMLGVSYALIALGMYIPFVMAGSLSIAYSAYAGIGAYAVAMVSDRTGWSVWVGWLIGAGVSVLVAIVLALATVRLSGFFLAAATLLVATAFPTWLLAAGEWTGGAGGISGIRSVTILGWEPSRMWQVFLGCLLTVAITVAIERIRRNPWGVIVRALRESPLAVEASGVRVTAITTVALAVGAAIASFGGSLFVSFVHGVTPETYTLSVVFMAIFIPLIGGRGTAWGAIVGAAVVVKLTLDMDSFQTSGELILAVAVILILLVAPGGILGYLDRFRKFAIRRIAGVRK